MKHDRLENMTKGWFVGAFAPAVLSTNDCEVAVKKYTAGEHEAKHYHKVATEVTLVLSGRVRMADREFSDGDIVSLEPGFATDFEALTDAITVVVKHPGASNDKYVV
jgi:anti-sigma factor ChrR (cupin superfamily)